MSRWPPPPDFPPACVTHPPTHQDVPSANTATIISYIKEKLHPNLNKAFSEAGLPYTNLSVAGSRLGFGGGGAWREGRGQFLLFFNPKR